jgi:thioredoxin-like negative regulator of GroEL
MGLRISVLLLLLAAPALGRAALVSEAADDVDWKDSFERALAEAGRRRLPVVVYFWIDGSEHCGKLYTESLSSAQGALELAHFVCVSAEARSAGARDLIARFGVTTLPTLYYLDPDGSPEDAIEGYIPLPGFLAESRRIRAGEGTVSGRRRAAEAAPDDLDVRLRLALQLEHVGLQAECEQLLASIKSEDPGGRTVAGAQLALYDVLANVRGAASDSSDPRTYDLAPLYAHMPSVTPVAIRFEAWKWIADVEQVCGNRAEERRALTEVWATVPEGSRLGWGRFLLQRFFQMESELSDAERRLAAEVGPAILEGARRRIAQDPEALRLGTYHSALAMALAIEGRTEEALAEVEKAIALEPESPDHRRLRDLFGAAGG